MVFTPNFRNVGSLAGETAVCNEPPCRLPDGEPRSEAPVSGRATGGPGLGGDMLRVGTLPRGREAAGWLRWIGSSTRKLQGLFLCEKKNNTGVKLLK